ncbi:hypothetical protein VW29_13895 [Devosia limi DSM 17137]|uniref:Protein-L-isoaspartate O-methyltransferase n=1 Tax=Devosia limi DSM 17137 TaxID=1121477 RepID=A0A0F5LN17_9HYPH|nr:protein-L-isoaspartate O-methyltransferase [Devosia limi]KKB83766.1 hypothetical protein VW29_13895 [Devosia limi DSM 17137]SHE70818.1 protein-L-isoaspartate(D-aspartate) O-methyltransferase [Devosia limi DSM 17137]
MIDFERARKAMVESQLRTSNVSDRRVLVAMGSVPRELFVPEARRAVAYIDDIQPIGAPGSRRFIAAPAVFGKLLQLAEIGAGDSVLDIGAGSGYSTAVLAKLAASVVGVEEDAGLVAAANANLAGLGLGNARVMQGSLSKPGKGAYDVVIVEGALDEAPTAAFGQLKEGGRLVVLIRQGATAVAHLYVKSGKGVAARADFNAVLPALETARREEEFVF